MGKLDEIESWSTVGTNCQKNIIVMLSRIDYEARTEEFSMVVSI